MCQWGLSAHVGGNFLISGEMRHLSLEGHVCHGELQYTASRLMYSRSDFLITALMKIISQDEGDHFWLMVVWSLTFTLGFSLCDRFVYGGHLKRNDEIRDTTFFERNDNPFQHLMDPIPCVKWRTEAVQIPLTTRYERRNRIRKRPFRRWLKWHHCCDSTAWLLNSIFSSLPSTMTSAITISE